MDAVHNGVAARVEGRESTPAAATTATMTTAMLMMMTTRAVATASTVSRRRPRRMRAATGPSTQTTTTTLTTTSSWSAPRRRRRAALTVWGAGRDVRGAADAAAAVAEVGAQQRVAAVTTFPQLRLAVRCVWGPFRCCSACIGDGAFSQTGAVHDSN